jgi:exodeoxyribonuclease VII small subunit
MDKQLTFEQAMERLEQIVSALESGKCTLDDSLKLFEEGTKLTAFCSEQLKNAEQKILKLTDIAGGEFSDKQGQNMGEALS